ncbi:hypothetical protein [Actinomadura alba]|uniref:Uncharacterized protein n=1 Tax=Actinomadura alba TaxID=406431 RepID=A0ABR7LQU0_9ACTN|nr:hypothetical protein [Actinomadura alba]MBC6467206.1 hypothetical protein [Actinomadura alba]
MTAGHGPAHERRSGTGPSAPQDAGPGRSPGGTRARAGDDTVADDCAMDFLSELDDVLWILEDTTSRVPEVAFRHAADKAGHVRELRRLLHRAHVVLVAWERELEAGD